MESTEIKASLNVDCIHLNCEMNTGHINTLKYVPKICNLDLSNAPKNAKNDPVLVKKLNYYSKSKSSNKAFWDHTYWS